MASYQKQLESLGFRYDSLTVNGYKKTGGFCFTVNISAGTKDYIISSACRPADESAVQPLYQALQQFAGERKKTVKTAAFNGKTITVICHTDDVVPNITKGVTEAVNFINYCTGQFGCVPCCETCGNSVDTGIYLIENNISMMCQDCFADVQNNIVENIHKENRVNTNYPLGIIGSVLGGLGGALIWIIFSMLGKIGYIAGAVAGMGGYFGFKKFGKKMTLKGLIISLVVSLAFLLCGMYLAIGIDIFNAFRDWDISFLDALEVVPDYLGNPEFFGEIIYNHIFGFLMFILGAVCCTAQFINEKKVKNRVIKLM